MKTAQIVNITHRNFVLELRLEKDKIVIVSNEMACVFIITLKFACGLTSFYIKDLPALHFTDLENATKLAAGPLWRT